VFCAEAVSEPISARAKRERCLIDLHFILPRHPFQKEHRNCGGIAENPLSIEHLTINNQ
jgi:hypothetical protein